MTKLSIAFSDFARKTKKKVLKPKPYFDPLNEPIQPRNPPRKSKAPFIAAAIFIVLSSSILFLTLLENTNTQNPETYPTPSPSSSPETQLPVNKINEEITTYEGNFYSFNYPSDLDKSELLASLSLHKKGSTQDDTKVLSLTDGISLSFTVYDLNDQDLSAVVDSDIEQILQTPGIELLSPIQEVRYGENSGYEYTVNMNPPLKRIFISNPNSTKYLKLTDSTIDPTNQGYIQIVHEIIESIKFRSPDTARQDACKNYGGTWIGIFNECENLPQTVCERLGGKYDSCASDCRNDLQSDVCTNNCVRLCIFE